MQSASSPARGPASFGAAGRIAPHQTSAGIATPRRSPLTERAMVDTGCLMRSRARHHDRTDRGCPPAGRAFTLAYDASGRLISVTDPIGRVVQYGYDPQGHLSS